MALKLSLKPGERVAINGTVLVNGDRRTTFTLEHKANVLRERDIMQPEEATTPARLVYLCVMMLALDTTNARKGRAEFEKRLTEFASVISDRGALDLCLKISARVASGDYYKALTHCRSLMDFEQERLDHVA